MRSAKSTSPEPNGRIILRGRACYPWPARWVASCVPWNDSCAMGDVDDFHRDFLPRFIDAQRAFHDGDPEPNNTLWSTTEPVSLFAARGLNAIGSEDVTKTFRFVSSWFSDVHSYEWVYTVTSGSSSPRCERRHGLHSGHRALHSITRGTAPGADRTSGQPHIPSRGRTVAYRAPARRPQTARPSGDLTQFPLASDEGQTFTEESSDTS